MCINCVAAFDYPDAPTRGLLNAIMSVGSIVALPITPYIADLAGRRVGIITGCLLMILGVILQSVGINIEMFIASRFFIGFGVAVAHGAAPLLISELVHPQHRAIFTTIYNSTWYVGSVIAAWVTFGKSTGGQPKALADILKVPSSSPTPGRGESLPSSRLSRLSSS